MERAGEQPRPRGPGLGRQLILHAAGDAEIDHFRLAIVADQDVARLEIAMDDAPPVPVGHPLAGLLEEPESLVERQGMLAGMGGDRPGAADQFHDEEGHRPEPALVHADGEAPGDGGMVEPGMDRRLLLEPATDGLGHHPQLHHLHRHLSRRGGLLAEVDTPHPPFAEQAEDAHATEIEADERIAGSMSTAAPRPRRHRGIAGAAFGLAVR